jgi:hypothetical protein
LARAVGGAVVALAITGNAVRLPVVIGILMLMESARLRSRAVRKTPGAALSVDLAPEPRADQ